MGYKRPGAQKLEAENVEELYKKQAALREEIEKIEKIERDIDGPLHKYQTERFQEELGGVEDSLLGFEELSDRQILILLSRRKKIIEVLGITGYVKSKSHFEAALAATKKKIDELTHGTKDGQ